jgi:hypothetical protein
MDSDNFYLKRDSRTIELVDSDYRNKKILVAIDDNIIRTSNGQVMLFTTLNLASRFCNTIDLLCDASVNTLYLPPKYYTTIFSNAMIKMQKAIDPFGEFNLVSHANKNYDAILSIGYPDIPKTSVTINNMVGYHMLLKVQKISK